MKIQNAIVSVMKELPSVTKAKAIKMGGGSYKALSYDDLIEEIQPLFVKYGITMAVSAENVEVKTVDIPKSDGSTIMNFMVSGTWSVCFSTEENSIEVKSFGYALDTSDKADGKAVTYATKSALVKCFAIKSEDNEEDRPYTSQSEPRQTFAGKPYRPEVSSAKEDQLNEFTSKKHWDELAALAKQKGLAKPPFAKLVSEFHAAKEKLLAMPDVK